MVHFMVFDRWRSVFHHARPADTAAASATSAVAAPCWLLLRNAENDCFLNAALQLMRRARHLARALDMRTTPYGVTGALALRETVLGKLMKFLTVEGTIHPRQFRRALPSVIKSLERDFLNTQQDSAEILTKIFDDVIPEYISKQFYIETSSRRRCRGAMTCKGVARKQSGPLFYQHIEANHQTIDLEAILFDKWAEIRGETEPMHCSACCPCCKTAAIARITHDEDTCAGCKRFKQPYVEEQRFKFKGNSDYSLIAFNILHSGRRMDWALDVNCDMDRMKLMGHYWRAVSVIKHIGSANAGHYVNYTREDDGEWWLHDDAKKPLPIGTRYCQRNEVGTVNMQGVSAILFEKIY